MNRERAKKAIQEGCRARGWSPLELARATRVAPEVIRRFMNDKGPVSPRTVNRLLRALDVDPKTVQ